MHGKEFGVFLLFPGDLSVARPSTKITIHQTDSQFQSEPWRKELQTYQTLDRKPDFLTVFTGQTF